MSVDKNHSEQFQRYLNGQMSPEEANAFERKVLDDPFAQEALEGFEEHGSESLEDLKILHQKLSSYKKKSFPFLRIAAVITLLMVASFSVYLFTDQIETDPLAMDEESIDEIVQSAPTPDTTFVQVKADSEKEIQVDELNDEEIESTVANIGEEVEEEDDQMALAQARKETPKVEVESIPVEVEVADLDEFILLDSTIEENPGKTFIGRVAGEEVRPTDESASSFFSDTNQPEERITTAQLVAKESEVSNANTKTEANEIAVRAKKAAGATSRSAAASKTIVGRITDDTGEPLPGVNVVTKGTTTGVVTNLDGYFELQKTENQTIVVSYVGFESQEVAVGDKSYVDVILGGATELSEVVITGYGETNEPRYSPAKPSIGTQAFKEYIEENLNYPEAAISNKIEGLVVLQLTIDQMGRVIDIDVKKSLGFGCDTEAIRLINDGPSWRAAKKDGKEVEDKLRVRVRFKLD